MENLSGRAGVVTGAASGIGFAITRRLAAEGVRLVLVDKDGAALADAAEAITATGGSAATFTADVSNWQDMQQLAEYATGQLGAVHILCNNAGIDCYRGGFLWEADAGDWERAMGVNVYGVVHGLRAFLPGMLASGADGHIVNTVSTSALIKAISVYGITKQALLGLTEALSHELEEIGANIGVTALCPGLTATSFFDSAPGERSSARTERDRRRANMAEKGTNPDHVAEVAVAAIRQNRFYAITDDGLDDDIRARFVEMLAR